ncbi:MAG: glycosyltransferase [Thermotogota bacterium]|nr:glycosyltransferase [Thermotogota bacterium]
MKRNLEAYRKIVGDEVISEIYKKTRGLWRENVLHINSTYQGGGVAEILNNLIPLMNYTGIDTDWRILHGTPDFFTITKKFHNALQGNTINLTEIKKQIYEETNEKFSTYTHINHDIVVIHDPQLLPLIKFYKKRQPWIWRCHIDFSNPNSELLDFLKQYILRYDFMILSNDKYIRKDLPIEQRIIYPAIDPLSPKNMEISDKLISKYLNKFGVKTDKPLITQISRFDRWKDPLGTIDIFKIVRKEVDCRLVLCGSSALDDPESQEMFNKVMQKAKNLIENGDVKIITAENQILVNCLQRSSDVIIQKSLKEGFGLTVTEALWKGKPVVASNVGGIPLQIKDGENGFLVDPYDIEGSGKRIIKILENPDLGQKMGERGKEVVRKKFLITRLFADHLDILKMFPNI